ncbi:hypothetical protein FJT64_007179 [Amphibalanus amphitrite]|uniref:Uncharacterized protein n=1 Tax=Amphibalanus amphitrite TaxID=1232801 RepID=A0A6A4W0E1_AMPAM|nr:hypothetical protein FJT64_007179 [Amphibalanus amphitrite]
MSGYKFLDDRRVSQRSGGGYDAFVELVRRAKEQPQSLHAGVAVAGVMQSRHPETLGDQDGDATTSTASRPVASEQPVARHQENAVEDVF